MQVTVEDNSSVKKTLHIEIPAENVKTEIDNAYKELKKTVRLNGFRAGKVPRSVLEAKFKKDVHQDVMSSLVQNSFVSAARDNEISIIGQPEFENVESFDGENDYKFNIIVEVKPEIGELNFKELSLKKTKHEFSEDEVDLQLSMLRKNLAKKVPVEDGRASEDGDLVEVDVEGKLDGEVVAPFKDIQGRRYRLGGKFFSEGFDKEVIGMKVGEEKTFDVVFPEDYSSDVVAGKTLSMTAKLTTILAEEMPELDDAFAKELGPFETLEDVKEEIRKNLKQGYDRRAEQELNEQIFEQIISRTDFELPDSLVKMELEHIVNEAERAFEANGTSLENIGKTKEDLEKEYVEVAENQVRRHLILDAIVNQEKFTVSDEELEEGYKELAANFNQSLEFIKSFYDANPDKIDYLKHTLLEKKALTLIMESNEVEEVEPELSPEKNDEI